MSDQMPDEVWLDEDTINGEFYASPQQVMATDVRYIRADLYELPEVPRCCGTCRFCAQDRMICYAKLGRSVAPHGLCSHWERRDGSC